MSDEKKKRDWGWGDVADLDEAIIFFAEKLSFGYHSNQIINMLDEYFPGIKTDYVTIGKIKAKALRWLKSITKNSDSNILIERAHSIIRLKKIFSNPHEKTKNILAADAQLAFRLGLDSKDEPIEEKAAALAAKMREFLAAAQAATDGTAFAAAQQLAESPQEEKNEKVGEKKDDTENGKTDEAGRESQKDEKEPEISEAEIEENRLADIALKLARAKRLKAECDALKSQGTKDKVNHDNWSPEDDS